MEKILGMVVHIKVIICFIYFSSKLSGNSCLFASSHHFKNQFVKCHEKKNLSRFLIENFVDILYKSGGNRYLYIIESYIQESSSNTLCILQYFLIILCSFVCRLIFYITFSFTVHALIYMQSKLPIFQIVLSLAVSNLLSNPSQLLIFETYCILQFQAFHGFHSNSSLQIFLIC